MKQFKCAMTDKGSFELTRIIGSAQGQTRSLRTRVGSATPKHFLSSIARAVLVRRRQREAVSGSFRPSIRSDRSTLLLSL